MHACSKVKITYPFVSVNAHKCPKIPLPFCKL